MVHTRYNYAMIITKYDYVFSPLTVQLCLQGSNLSRSNNGVVHANNNKSVSSVYTEREAGVDLEATNYLKMYYLASCSVHIMASEGMLSCVCVLCACEKRWSFIFKRLCVYCATAIRRSSTIQELLFCNNLMDGMND